MAVVLDLERAEISRTLAASDLRRLAARWIAEAVRHERAADGIHERDRELATMDEEQMIHLEVARTLRNCARDLTA